MSLRDKIFWGIFYSLVFGYLMDGLIQFDESPMDSVKNFPLQFKDKGVTNKKEVVNKPL